MVIVPGWAAGRPAPTEPPTGPLVRVPVTAAPISACEAEALALALSTEERSIGAELQELAAAEKARIAIVAAMADGLSVLMSLLARLMGRNGGLPDPRRGA